MVKENDELLKLASYVQISKYREKTLKSIGDDVKIPTKTTVINFFTVMIIPKIR